jgi:O-antigen/teichoic acid export membrane protein
MNASPFGPDGSAPVQREPQFDNSNSGGTWQNSSPSGLKRSAVRGWAVTMAGQVTKFLLQMAATVVLARILTPKEYGLVAMVTAFLGIVTLFKDLGLSQATVQRESITHGQVTGLFWINVAMGLLLMLVIAAMAPFIAWVYKQHELVWIALAFALMAPITSLGAQHSALLQRRLDYRSLALRDLLATTVGTAAGIASGLCGLGYWSLVIMQAVSEIMGTITLWWRSSWVPGWPHWSADLKPLLRFGGNLTISNLIGFFMNGLDSVTLGVFFGPVAVGNYNRAQNVLAKPLQQLIPPVTRVAASVFARTATEPARFERAALQLTFLICSVAGLIVAVTMVCADWIVSLVLGAQWIEAVPIVRVLALFAFVEPMAALVSTLLLARGLPEKILRWRVFSVSIVLLGLFAGLPWGPLGVATTYSLSGLLLRTPLFVWYASKHLAVPGMRFFAAAATPLLAAACAAGLMTVVRETLGPVGGTALSLALYGLLGSTIWLSVIWSLPVGRRRMRESFSLITSGLTAKPC